MSMASLAAARLRTTVLKSRNCSHLRYFSSSLTRFQNDEAPETPPKPPKSIDDSTAAVDYKSSYRVPPPALPSMDLPRSRTAEEAVTNILYNTPPPSLQPFKKSVALRAFLGFFLMAFLAMFLIVSCKMSLVYCQESRVSLPEEVSTSSHSSSAVRKLGISVG